MREKVGGAGEGKEEMGEAAKSSIPHTRNGLCIVAAREDADVDELVHAEIEPFQRLGKVKLEDRHLGSLSCPEATQLQEQTQNNRRAK